MSKARQVFIGVKFSIIILSIVILSYLLIYTINQYQLLYAVEPESVPPPDLEAIYYKNKDTLVINISFNTTIAEETNKYIEKGYYRYENCRLTIEGIIELTPGMLGLNITDENPKDLIINSTWYYKTDKQYKNVWIWIDASWSYHYFINSLEGQ